MDDQLSAKTCPFAVALAEQLRAAKNDLVLHWLNRIAERVSLEPRRVFPTDDLLDHVPLLIDGIADYLENPSAEISADLPVVGKAMELGALRHAQGFDAYEILKEYEILGGILFSFLARSADALDQPCEKSELLVCGHRLFQAITLIQQTTTTHYLRLADGRVAEREARLRAFNRAISHEIKNHIGVILGTSQMLVDDVVSRDDAGKFHRLILRNARDMKGTLDNLLELARLEGDARKQRHVRLPEAVKEATRQVRESAEAARVRVSAGQLPDVEVNAAVVELCLTNYLTNAIKYADRSRPDSHVEISADIRDQSLVVSVADNGLGVPVEQREHLFERFFRAHRTVTPADGTGLGLSIVRETVESVGGRAWAEFPGPGSRFMFAMPFRRETAGDRRAGAADGGSAVQGGTSPEPAASRVSP